MTNKQLIKALKEHEKRLAKQRDELRDVVDEYEAMEEVCNKTIECLEITIDSLSEIV